MERKFNIQDKRLYEGLYKLALKFAELKDYEMTQKILTIMIKTWPERVISKGELASDTDISDS